MKFVIKHDIKGRIRVHFINGKMSYRDADIVPVSYTHLDVYKRQMAYRLQDV